MQRWGYLNDFREADPELLAAVNELLADDREPNEPDATPGHIGPFKILGILGEGGMGIVYLAEQREPVRRRVALKVIKPGMDSKAVIARFEAERQALAMMDHPNIAKIFDAGTTPDGRPYFVMEHVKGEPITAYADRHLLTMKERLELFIQVCQAVQHAHSKTVIHRDLKPSNVLVTTSEGNATPKVIDFGIAKATERTLTERTVFTQHGQLIGTPEYASPEQAEIGALDIDTRTDVYSLGVMLYELLVGALPFEPTELRKAGLREIQRIIREQEPPRPSVRLGDSGASSSLAASKRQSDPVALGRRIRGDLDWITMMAMEKDRDRRYATATALAEDVARHLADEPVLAGPPSAGYRFRKFVRRNRKAASATAVAGAGLVIGTIISLFFAHAQSLAREEAAEQATALQAVVDILAQADPYENPQPDVTLRQTLDRVVLRTDLRHAKHPLARVAIWSTAARVYLNLGRIEEADEMLRRAMNTLDSETQGRLYDQVSRARCLRLMGEVSNLRGNYTQAKVYFEDALDLWGEVPGDYDNDVAAAMCGLGEMQYRLDHPQEAIAMFRATMALLNKTSDPDHNVLSAASQNLAFVLQNTGHSEHALAMYRNNLATQRRRFGDRSPHVSWPLNDLGMWYYYRAEDYALAEPCLREAYTIRRDAFGEDHPATVTATRNLAKLLRERGEYEEAAALFRIVIDHYRAQSATDAYPMKDQSDMAVILAGLGKNKEACGFGREAVRLSLAKGDPEGFYPTWSVLGQLCTKLGRFDEAARCYRASVKYLQDTSGATHEYTLYEAQRLATVLNEGERYDEAEAVARELLGTVRTMPEPEEGRVASALAALGKSLLGLQKGEEAEAAVSECLAIRRRNNSEDCLIARTEVLLSQCLAAQGRMDAAAALLNEMLDTARLSCGSNDVLLGVFLAEYGQCLVDVQQYADAETALLESHEILTSAEQSTSRWQIKVTESLLDSGG